MDRDHYIKRKTNPRLRANIFSKLLFFYTIKLYIKGYTRGLETKDIYEVLPNCRSKQLADDLERKWQKEKSTKLKPSICHSLWYLFGKYFLVVGFIQFAFTILMTVWSPRALSKLISYFSPGQTNLTKEDAIFYACVVVGFNMANVFVRQHARLALVSQGIRAKTAVSSLLYRKSLKLSSESLSKVTAGKIITIITKDVDWFEWFMCCGNDIWIAFVKICLICYLVYTQIGIASVPGIVFFFLVIPVQVIIGQLGYRLRLKCNRKTDERLELIRELLSAIKIIKMYTWEKFFEVKINTARKKELKTLHKIFYTKMWISLISSLSSKISFFIFLMTYVWMGNNVTAEIIYYILSCCNNLEENNDIPFVVSYLAETYAAIKRIESVLEAEELAPSHTESGKPQIEFNRVYVKIHNSSVLENVSMTISDGLNIVTGHTGSGKTTFLKTILRDCHMTGEVTVRGKVSYASQEPWLFPSTIKNNILFGEKYNEKRYRQILELCCLDYDLRLLPEGDETIVGDRGINLSRGQQARVNLARAVYKDSDIYLLDDCLAALDGHVSDNIFRKCICGFLGRKIRVFVTNNDDYIQSVDKVIEINSGVVDFVEKSKTEIAASDNTIQENQETETAKVVAKEIYHETKRSGRVPLKYYHKYLKYGGGLTIFALVVAVFIMAQSTSSVSEKLLSKWVTLEQNLSTYNTSRTDSQELTLYATTAMVSILLISTRTFAFYLFTRKACVNVHKAMIRNIANSTMKFFDSTFIGNILTRFVKDCVTLDETLPYVSMECLGLIFTASGGVILLTTVDYVFLLECLLLLATACVIKQFCQPTGRNLERMHVMARSPMNGHLNSTLEGLTTIRACRAQKIVSDEFDRHQDLFASAFYMVVTNFIALWFFLKFTCSIFIAFIIAQFLIFTIDITVGDVGLVITQAFVITGIITSGIISVADCENLMISVERMLEYTELEEEDTSGQILIGWPKSGHVSFNGVSLTYGDTTKEMLNNVSFVINPAEKLGVVGRTGAGKSSLVSALFRLYDTKGTITIDETDIQSVSLKWLRSSISVIPQDPYLFSGTVRENLDPLKLYKDDAIWEVLEELKLKPVIKDLNVKVDKGATFSAGQKQLLCLARAILRKAKIMVLDEATANVDQETDTLINEAVQKHFSDCTLIVVAHRLLTVLNCNNVLVLNNGRISEFDAPHRLMQDRNSFFRCVIK